jgi:hypothetical protein
MDILFWIFIGILLLILYNCYFKKQSQPTPTSLEGFYNQYLPQNLPQQNYFQNISNQKSATDPGQYTQTTNSGAYNAGLISTEPQMQGIKEPVHSSNLSSNFSSNLSSQLSSQLSSFAPFDNTILGEDKKTGIITESTPDHLFVQQSLNCNSKKQLSNVDLLPLDQETTTWAKLNPKPDGWLETKNFLQAGYHLGLNTVGQTKKNANYQLRSEPANPKDVVSVWNQSQIDPDTRRCFEIN